MLPPQLGQGNFTALSYGGMILLQELHLLSVTPRLMNSDIRKHINKSMRDPKKNL